MSSVVGLHVVTINADPSGSLGGSVSKDTANVSAAIHGYACSADNCNGAIYHKQHIEVRAAGDIPKSIATMKQDIRQFRAQHPGAKNVVVVYISGHGYQVPDINGDELDGADECIHLAGGVRVLDDEIRAQFVDGLANHYDCIIGIADTCHSGTMFDLKSSYNFASRSWVPGAISDNLRAISIGACLDSGLAACDVGDATGFGGALTVQLLNTKYKDTNMSLLVYIVDRAVCAVAKNEAIPISAIVHSLHSCNATLSKAFGQNVVISCE